MTPAEAVQLTLNQCSLQASGRSIVVGISGIDGSGKRYIAAQMAEQLAAAGCRIASINVDGWLNLPEKRFDPRRSHSDRRRWRRPCRRFN